MNLPWKRIFPVLLTLVVWTAVAGPGFATSYEGWTVHEVKLEGLPAGVGAGAAKGLGLASPTGFRRTGKVRFQDRILQEDLRRLKLLLARAGYPYARLKPEFRPRSGSYNLEIIFRINPGAPVFIGAVRLTGRPDAGPDLDETIRRLLPPGSRFGDGPVDLTVNRVRLLMQRAGYALAEVQAAVSRPDSFLADIELKLVAGERYRIDRLEVTGIPADLVPLALRTMDIRAGDRYAPERVARARQNLRELQLFRQIKLQTEPVAPRSLALHAELKPAALRTARLSVGSWSDDPIRLRGQWRHRNFFGGGRGLEFRGAYSPHRQEVGAGAWWPALMAARSLNELWARYDREDEDAYQVETVTLETAALWRPADRTTLRLAAAVENVRVEVLSDDPDVYDGDSGTQLVLSGRWHGDRSDHLLYPTRGTRWTLDLVGSPPGFLSRAPFVSAELTGVLYRPLPGGLVLALRAAVGAAEPLGEATDLQPHRRFFAGGVTTMRGYKRRRLGPVDAAGDPVGGEARLLTAAELRVPVVGFLEAALFLDGGQVWSRNDAVTLRDLETAAGGGLVFHTPVGPVRLDVAGSLGTPRTGEPRTVFHLAVGHPF